MADHEDRIHATHEVDDAVAELDRLADLDAATGPLVTADLVAIACTKALVAAVRELGVRLDYVARDLEARRRR